MRYLILVLLVLSLACEKPTKVEEKNDIVKVTQVIYHPEETTTSLIQCGDVQIPIDDTTPAHYETLLSSSTLPASEWTTFKYNPSGLSLKVTWKVSYYPSKVTYEIIRFD